MTGTFVGNKLDLYNECSFQLHSIWCQAAVQTICTWTTIVSSRCNWYIAEVDIRTQLIISFNQAKKRYTNEVK